MKISVCIPTCNRPTFVREAVESCLFQSHLPDEILIGDDSSNDETKNAIDKLIKENSGLTTIKYYKNETSLGQADNVNSLIDRVGGDKMILLHDDDLLLPSAIEVLSNCFLKDPTLAAAFGKQYIINEEGVIDHEQSRELNTYFFRTTYYYLNPLSSVEAGMVQQFPNDAYMINVEVAKKMKYRKKEQIGNAGDFDFGFRLGIAGYKLFFFNNYVAKYRVTALSVARSGTDSAFQAFKIVSKNSQLRRSYRKTVDYVLSRKAPIALMQAKRHGYQREAFDIYFSRWHRKKIFTLGGARRLLFLLK